MPPKQEITKKRIFSAGLELVRAQGIESVTARSLAASLHCSTQPIYSTFHNMEDLKSAVFGFAADTAMAQIRSFQDSRYIPQLCLAIGYLRLAKLEKELFRSVFLSEYGVSHGESQRQFGEEILSSHVPQSTRMKHADMDALRRIFFKMSVYITGLGAMISSGALDCTVEEGAAMISDIYETLMAGENLKPDGKPAATPLLGKVVGSGANADVFDYGGGKVLKLFRNKDQAGDRDYEFRNHTAIQRTGLPIPQLFQKVEVDGKPGLIYEKIEGETVAARMFGESGPDDIRLLAQLIHQIHCVRISVCPELHLPKVKDVLHWQIEHSLGLSEGEKSAVLAHLSDLPDSASLCHGDLNPLNVIIREGKPVIIDWQGASIGHPTYDAMQLLLIWRYAVVPEQLFPKEFIDSFAAKREVFYRVFLHEHLRLSGSTEEEVDRWMIPVAAAKLNDGHCEEERNLLLGAIRAGLARATVNPEAPPQTR